MPFIPEIDYVAEDGSTIYVAEDGTTIYVKQIGSVQIPGVQGSVFVTDDLFGPFAPGRNNRYVIYPEVRVD